MWDWWQQPDLDDLTNAIRELSGGALHMRQVNTGSDDYAVVLSTVELDDDAARAVYERG